MQGWKEEAVMRSNYLAALSNPFNLVGPPDWFLDDLAAYDDQLVIFPSQEEGVYRIARKHQGHAPPIFTFLKDRPDTKVFVANRLVPVTSVLPPPLVQWGPVIINDLAEKDIQRVGGWEAASRLLEDAEDTKERRLDRTIADDAEHLARFAWQAIKWRTGQKLDLGARKPEGARSRTPTRRRQFAYRPTAAGAGFWRDHPPARNRAAYVDTDVVVAR